MSLEMLCSGESLVTYVWNKRGEKRSKDCLTEVHLLASQSHQCLSSKRNPWENLRGSYWFCRERGMVARWQVSGAHQIGKLFMHNPYPKMSSFGRKVTLHNGRCIKKVASHQYGPVSSMTISDTDFTPANPSTICSYSYFSS